MLYTSDLPAGNFFTVELILDSALWSDTTSFPCNPSLYEPAFPSCDYILHGWQTVPGSPDTVMVRWVVSLGGANLAAAAMRRWPCA